MIYNVERFFDVQLNLKNIDLKERSLNVDKYVNWNISLFDPSTTMLLVTERLI